MAKEAHLTRGGVDKAPAGQRERADFQEVPGEAEAVAVGNALLLGTADDPDRIASLLRRVDGGTRARMLSRLQRQRGNGYVQRLVATSLDLRERGPREQTAIQRAAKSPEMPEDVAKQFSDMGGDELIGGVKADLSTWEGYRRAPVSMEAMPGKAASAAIRAFLKRNDDLRDATKYSWVKFYASSRVGAQGLARLAEMVAMNPVFAVDVGLVFNVKRPEKVEHKYKMTQHAAAGVSEGALQTFVPAVDISYSNSLGWSWSRKFNIPGISISLGISKGGAPFDVEVNEQNPNVVQPSFEQGREVAPGVEVGLLQVDVDGTAEATAIQYYGYDDLQGEVRTVAGPSIEGQCGAGGKYATGSLIQFVSQRSVPLTFNQLDVSLKWSNVSMTRKTVPKFKLQVIGEGAGYALGGQGSYGQPPEYEPLVVQDSRQWATSVFYETGSDIPPDAVADQLIDLARQVRMVMSQLKIEEDKAFLKEKGIDLGKAMALDLTVVGHASRGWRGAGSERKRVAENEALAVRRAVLLVRLLATAFERHPGNITSSATGAGPGTLGRSYDIKGEDSPTLAEGSAQQTYLYEKEKANKTWDEQRKKAQEESDPKRRAEAIAEIESKRKMELSIIEHLYGPGSDQVKARRADITVVWNGFRVAHELPAVPVQKGAAGPAKGP